MARKPLTDEQLLKREQSSFARRIQATFKNAGFEYIPTRDIQRAFGDKTGELDQVFLYENLLLVCEDTVSASSNARAHLKNKKLLFDEVDKDKKSLLEWLKTDFPERFAAFDDYDLSRYKIFYLYFSKQKVTLTPSEESLYAPVMVVENSSLSYFHKMSQNIKFSSRTDIFRFLKLQRADVGNQDSSTAQQKIETTIIYPADNTGLQNGVRLVSFMVSAASMLRNGYVLRKDNWENSIQLYQRLIEKDRILNIRRHLATKKRTFFNNIIVSLPDSVTFEDAEGNAISLEQAQSFGSHKMLIPDEFNSIGVIDGQHRIYAHYEGIDMYEETIKKLRGKFHLLATGLIFPPEMGPLQRRKFESEIFLDINSNARPVPPDVLLFIETLMDPFSDLGVARQVIDLLNRRAPFENLFQLSLMENSRIKIASIIKFALRYLVEITNEPDRITLFAQWASNDPSKLKLLEKKNETLLNEYIEYVANVLDQYFSALRATHKTDWKDDASKILSTTSINAFLIALRRSLPAFGVRDFEFYRTRFATLSLSFSKEEFGHTSSQYNKLSKVILDQSFGLQESAGKWVPKKSS